MEKPIYLTMKEYSGLFEHIIVAEYDNLFHNAPLRCDLGLRAQETGRFAAEYLCAALFLLDDLAPDSRMPKAVYETLVSCVRSGVFRSILPESALEGTEAPYILYSLKRSAALAPIYARDDESMKQLIENCIDQAQLTDQTARMPQSVYLMQLLPGIVQLYCDLLCSVQLEDVEDGQPQRFRMDSPEA